MSTLKAARADNFYFPKEWDPTKGSLNKFQGQHPLRERAAKLDQGILVVRYETPYHVRCFKCEQMIAKGVRFNAEKKCIGKYMTTKIWEFRMNCHNCGNKIACQTDPKNTQFNYVDGAKKWMDTQDATDAAFLPDAQDKDRMKVDAFYNLENVMDDEVKAQDLQPIIESLERQNEEKYGLDFEINLKMRRIFKEAKEKEDKKPKNFCLPLTTPKTIDHVQARHTKFKQVSGALKTQMKKREEIRTQNIFQKEKKKKLNEKQKLELKISKLPRSTQKCLKYEIKQASIIKNQLGTIHKF